MLQEYAVDPSALGSSWERCRYILDQAGWDIGRLIAAYPRRSWMREAIRASEPLRDIEKARVREALRVAGLYKIVKTGRRVCNGDVDWLTDAMLQQNIEPFQAIVADAPELAANSIINIDAVSATTPLWHCPVNWQIPKTAAAMAAALSPLIRFSHDIKLVDPYFDVTSRRYLPVLTQIFRLARDAGRPVIEVHCEARDQILNIDQLERQAPHGLQAQIPDDIMLKVFWWSERRGGRRLHARYAVTERGGIKIDHGFSEIADSVEDLSLMGVKVRENVFTAFSIDSHDYDQVGCCLKITNQSITRSAS
jgi:hypothetical protein